MNVKHFAAAGLLLLAACSRQEASQTAADAKAEAKEAVSKVADALDIGTPYDGKPSDPAAREKERFDRRWRELESFRERQAQAQAAASPAQPPQGFRFATGVKETFEGVTPQSLNAAPATYPLTGDVKGPGVLRAQVYLDRLHFSVGAIDGRWGRNSAVAVWAYQRSRGIDPTGDVDEKTLRQLASDAAFAPVVKEHTITAEDMKGPFIKVPEDVYEKEKLDCLCYESVQEVLGEKFHADRDLLDLLNPRVKWSELKEGDRILVPNVREPWSGGQKDIARIVVSIAGNSLNGLDASGRIIFHAPTTLGSGYDPSPRETLTIKKIVPDPHFHYNPKLYHEVPDTDEDAHLKPGPNSPVGVVWMALSKRHYGIHGTAEPESIGYASSHGCVRLTNWDARELSMRAPEGAQVAFFDRRGGEPVKTAAR